MRLSTTVSQSGEGGGEREKKRRRKSGWDASNIFQRPYLARYTSYINYILVVVLAKTRLLADNELIAEYCIVIFASRCSLLFLFRGLILKIGFCGLLREFERNWKGKLEDGNEDAVDLRLVLMNSV